MELQDLPKDKMIILFDGVCNLCDNTVQYIIKKDKKDIFRFIPLQSDLGMQIVKYIGIDTSKTDSILLYEPGKAYYYKAQAAIKIAGKLGGIVSALQMFSAFPKGITNAAYDFIAKNRYKWFGKKDECMLPTPEMKSKFL